MGCKTSWELVVKCEWQKGQSRGDDSAAATTGKLSSTSLCLPPSSPNHPKPTGLPAPCRAECGPSAGCEGPCWAAGSPQCCWGVVVWGRDAGLCVGAVWGHRKERGLGYFTCGSSVVHKVTLWVGHHSGLSSHACLSQGELCREARLCSGHPGEMFCSQRLPHYLRV